jgi:aminomethyltransferase
MSLKRTALYASHQKLGGKLIEFGGWEMPVQYTSIVDEHQCVRNAAGVFDICHMGEVRVTGAGAAAWLNSVLGNDIRKLAVGQGQYTHLCNEHGGTVDDLYAYRTGETEFLLIINASRIEPDVAWFRSHLPAAGSVDLTFTDESAQTGAIAIQGPKVAEFINALFPGASLGGTAVAAASELKKNQIGAWKWNGETIWVARTGYTGEDGFEVVAPVAQIVDLWDKTLEAGRASGIKPSGLGARDTLRTEVCYPLYGHELDENTSPIEAGLGVFVSLDKGEFIGRSVLAAQKANGVTKKSVAFRMIGKAAPPRPGYPIWANDAVVGTVVSGTQSPSLNCGIGLGYVPPTLTEPGTTVEIEIRGRRFPAEIVKKPIYRKA